jgi:hypothetical protein
LVLAHRTLKLSATHGRISPSSVKTDGSGRATATFTATSKGIARIQADYGPYETVTHQRDQRRGEAAIAVKASGIWEMSIDASWQENGSVSRGGVNSEEAHSTLEASAHAFELIRTPNPLPSDSHETGWDTLGGQAQATASETETDLQVDHIPDGQTCRSTYAYSGTGADGLPDLVILTSKPLKLGLDFSVKGTSHGTFHCSPYDDNPGDNTMRDSHGYKLTNSAAAGWQGSCTRQGTVKRGYTIVCNGLHTSYRDYGLAGSPNATVNARLRVTMTPL